MESPEQETTDLTPRKRRWAVVASAVVFVLALALAPPLFNLSRLQHRIAASMSASLGRPVHIDPEIHLHLLPMPGLTLTNLVVSEDPAFGVEPTIRANEVDITLRPSSLWRRQVEAASIRFVEPSLNLVRTADGKWNIEGLLMHAAQIDTAPTAQSKAGPVARFPYIDATHARINVKMGYEKMPFSLTDTDFALWLPSPQQWHVQIEGTPARTDMQLSDPGVIRVDGTLERAAHVSDVPVKMHASWHDAPLGEVTEVLSGSDAGWRGTLQVDTDMTGTMGNANVATKMTVTDLRRSDFVPARLLDISVTCSGTLNVFEAVMTGPQCTLPDSGTGMINAVATQLDLTTLKTSGLQVASGAVAESWLLDWARMFGQKIPAEERGVGNVAGALTWVQAQNGAEGYWEGEVHGALGRLKGLSTEDGGEYPQFSVKADADGFALAPVNIAMDTKAAPLTLGGIADRKHYALTLRGTATPEQMVWLTNLLPPLGEGFAAMLPKDADAKATKVDVTCSRVWSEGPETCAAAEAETPKPVRRGRK